jgi:hypothetical protein
VIASREQPRVENFANLDRVPDGFDSEGFLSSISDERDRNV